MIIKNKQALATTELRTQALEIIEAGIARVLPEVTMRSSISYDHSNRILTVNGHNYDASKGRIFVIGGGKASGLMAEMIEDIVGINNIMAGVVTCKSGSNNFKTRKVEEFKFNSFIVSVVVDKHLSTIIFGESGFSLVKAGQAS